MDECDAVDEGSSEGYGVSSVYDSAWDTNEDEVLSLITGPNRKKF